MHKHLALAAILGFLVGPATASASGWEGFYIGGNAGVAAGHATSSLGVSDGAGSSCHFDCPPAVIPGYSASDSGAAAAAGSPSFSPNGFTGGLQLGYNWQSSNWVYGLEFDFGAFSQRETANTVANLSSNTNQPAPFGFGFFCNGAACQGNFATSVSTDWLMTIRPRVGFIWDDNLLYATGGLALTRISISQTYSDNLFSPGVGQVGGTESSSATKTKVGWTLGAGIEHSLGEHWSAKAEYLYVHFSGVDMAGDLIDPLGGTAHFSNSISLSSNIVRVGVNYKF